MLNEITPCFVELPNRGLIKVGGEDAFKFLQNLITNDVSKLDTQDMIHSCLLTAQGKFLHDFYITKSEDIYFLDCESGDRMQDLLKRLTMYRLRSKVTFDTTDQNKVYALIDGPRFFEKPDLPEAPFEVWDRVRISKALADGSRDAEIEKSTLSELNMEEGSIDYNKGCYVGQELTARIHHRGLAKKHLFPVQFEGQAPAWGTPLLSQGKTIGEMRSSCGNIGLALLKDELLPLSQNGFYMVDIA